MKKALVNLTTLTAGILLASIIISCNKPQNQTTTNTADTGKKTDLIVYVNSDSLLNNYEYFKAIKKTFEEKSKKAQADLSAKGQAFQQEVVAYQKNGSTLSATERTSTEERLGRKQQELATYNQNASAALAREEAAENEKLYNKVSDYLKIYAKEKGYKFVLTFSKTDPTVLYGDPTLDITKQVVSGLNEDYKKENK